MILAPIVPAGRAIAYTICDGGGSGSNGSRVLAIDSRSIRRDAFARLFSSSISLSIVFAESESKEAARRKRIDDLDEDFDGVPFLTARLKGQNYRTNRVRDFNAVGPSNEMDKLTFLVRIVYTILCSYYIGFLQRIRTPFRRSGANQLAKRK